MKRPDKHDKMLLHRALRTITKIPIEVPMLDGSDRKKKLKAFYAAGAKLEDELSALPLALRSFSHAEALHVAGLTNDAVMTWYKREQLPKDVFPLADPGRGNRRRYSIFQIAVLSAVKALISVGVSVKEAMDLSPSFAAQVSGFFIDQADQPVMEATKRILNEEHPLIAVFKMPPGSKIEGILTRTATEFGFMSILSRDSQGELVEWMRKCGVAAMSIIDRAALATEIITRAHELVGAR